MKYILLFVLFLPVVMDSTYHSFDKFRYNKSDFSYCVMGVTDYIDGGIPHCDATVYSSKRVFGGALQHDDHVHFRFNLYGSTVGMFCLYDDRVDGEYIVDVHHYGYDSDGNEHIVSKDRLVTLDGAGCFPISGNHFYDFKVGG